MNRFLLQLLCWVSLCCSACSVAAQTLPINRTYDWTQAGFDIQTLPSWPTVQLDSLGLVGDGITPNDSVLAQVLSTYGGSGVVLQFGTGTYLFKSTIDLPSAVVLRGNGPDQTILQSDLNGNGHTLTIQGSRGSDSTYFRQSAARGDLYVQLLDPTMVQAGDWVRLQQYDADWVTSNWSKYCTGQVVQIDRVEGDTAWLKTALRLDYDRGRSAALWRIDPAQYVGVECLKLLRISDTAPQQRSNIFLYYAVQCWVSGIESENCTFAHIEAEYSAQINIAHSYFHHGFSYGGNGRAYGVVFQMASSDCRAEDNIFEHLRHSVLLQSGANGNVIAYNYSWDPYWDNIPHDGAGDLVLHGNYAYANLFEHNIAQQVAIDNSHGPNGPHNVFFRNRLQSYGLFNNANSPNQTFIANEITNNTFPYRLANYRLQGTGHFVYGNNDKGTVKPTGTQQVPDVSYAYPHRPDFVPVGQWGVFGTPNPYNAGSIPAYDRFQTGNLFQGTCGNRLPVYALKVAASSTVQVYPNPSKDWIRVESEGPMQHVVLYSLTGQMLKVWSPQQSTVVLQWSNIPQGVYVLSIEQEGQPTQFQQVIIQKS